MHDCFSKLDPKIVASLEDQHVQDISAKGLAAFAFLDDAGVVLDEGSGFPTLMFCTCWSSKEARVVGSNLEKQSCMISLWNKQKLSQHDKKTEVGLQHMLEVF